MTRFCLVCVLWLAVGASVDAADLPVDRTLTSHRVAIESGDGTRISGYLFRPKHTERRPAVLMMHGCSGLLTPKYGRLKTRERAWRDIFLAEGYVVLLLDSFTDRGHRNICNVPLRERPVTPDSARPHDAYGALLWLQSRPFVVPEKIALGGWSNGAMALLWTVFTDASQRPETLAHDFRVAFGFYPGCIELRKRLPRFTAAVPTVLQLGSEDNWTWPKPCQELANEARGGASISIDVYADAAHTFDHPNLEPRTITVSNGRRVRVGTHRQSRDMAIRRIKTLLRASFTD